MWSSTISVPTDYLLMTNHCLAAHMLPDTLEEIIINNDLQGLPPNPKLKHQAFHVPHTNINSTTHIEGDLSSID